MLDRMLCVSLVAMFFVGLCQPNIGFVFPRIERDGLLKTLDGFGDVATKHFRGDQVLTAKAGPHTGILVVERHSLGILLFDFRAELLPHEHPCPPGNHCTVKYITPTLPVTHLIYCHYRPSSPPLSTPTP